MCLSPPKNTTVRYECVPITLSSAELQERGAAFSAGLSTAPQRLYQKAATNTEPVAGAVDCEKNADGCLDSLLSRMSLYPITLSSAKLQEGGTALPAELNTTAPRRLHQKTLTKTAEPADAVDSEKYGCPPLLLPQSGMNACPIALSSAELQERGAAFSAGLESASQRLYKKAEISEELTTGWCVPP
eukprot:CAMPEP_0206406606 /NCGR_PEP_ID=MMETSP0294-20121207/29920_1 /ASSEMBLY_ACC=CAM_ASM_000327 /TAXON_ID=39354 /ORGANISM="Heterosigma akashiwo, Strain CCMP2393" /LENGTH=186 /DNA_ID=CAMNT_0053865439 /DNA_START=168 /DNA_END=731 /DNA_ORIENTATION=-